MEFKVEGYQYSLNCLFENNQITAHGQVWREEPPVSLKFPIGAMVEIEFNRKKVKAPIYKFTKNNQVIVKVSETQTKKIDLYTLVSKNRFTEICYRIENENGEGPYRSNNPSANLLKWREAKRNQYEQERINGLGTLHPTIELDMHLHKYPLVTQHGLFGFKTLEQMNKWFTQNDLSLLESEGFKVVIKQKGLDYYNSFFSYTQMVIVKNEEDYNKIISSEQSFFY